MTMNQIFPEALLNHIYPLVASVGSVPTYQPLIDLATTNKKTVSDEVDIVDLAEIADWPVDVVYAAE